MSGTLRDGQGQSSITVFKQRRFERFLWQHMRMVKGILAGVFGSMRVREYPEEPRIPACGGIVMQKVLRVALDTP